MARIDLGGGSFFDPDGAQDAIKKLTAERDKYDDAIQQANSLTKTVAPGPDPVTAQFHTPMQASHAKTVNDLKAVQQDFQNIIDNIKAAVKFYTGADESGAHGLKQKGD
jgi:ABC-type transporter Mla subunit MlaD